MTSGPGPRIPGDHPCHHNQPGKPATARSTLPTAGPTTCWSPIRATVDRHGQRHPGCRRDHGPRTGPRRRLRNRAPRRRPRPPRIPHRTARRLLGTRFDAITCRGVLNDLLDDADRDAAAVALARHLKRTSVLFLDVREPTAPVSATPALTSQRTAGLDDGHLTFHATGTYTDGLLHVREQHEHHHHGTVDIRPRRTHHHKHPPRYRPRHQRSPRMHRRAHGQPPAHTRG
jgi:hypothetical protein